MKTLRSRRTGQARENRYMTLQKLRHFEQDPARVPDRAFVCSVEGVHISITTKFYHHIRATRIHPMHVTLTPLGVSCEARYRVSVSEVNDKGKGGQSDAYRMSIRAGRGERVKRMTSLKNLQNNQVRQLVTHWSALVARSTFEQRKTRRALRVYTLNVESEPHRRPVRRLCVV